LLSEYLNAVDALTINEENRLKREVEMLKVRKSDYEFLKEQFEEYKQAQAAEYEQLQERIYNLNKRLAMEEGKE
jgi:hypothetical protein